jgi:hypothetical protein
MSKIFNKNRLLKLPNNYLALVDSKFKQLYPNSKRLTSYIEDELSFLD